MSVAAGDRITAGMFPATKSATEDSQSTFGTTSYVETPTGGAAFPSLTFVAPTSGEVIVSVNALVDNTTTLRTYYGWVLRTGSSIGSGTVILAAADERAISNFGTDDGRQGAEFHVPGLTAGATYNLRAAGKVSSASANAGQVQSQHIIVKPCQ